MNSNKDKNIARLISINSLIGTHENIIFELNKTEILLF